MIQIKALGGYGEVGRNMTLIKIGDEAVVLDMGLHLDKLLDFSQDEDLNYADVDVNDLINNGVIADDRTVDKASVKGIILSHGHLDHIGAVPFMERNYDCPIVCTTYTGHVLDRQFKDNKIKQRNKTKMIGYNQQVKLGLEFSVEFVRVTHSIPQSAVVILHTRFGAIVYANDFKLDMTPVLGKPTDIERLTALKGNVKLLISECLRAKTDGKTASEQEAVKALEETVAADSSEKNLIYVTTFSSHIERLHTIVKIAKKHKRSVIFLGRSLEKYSSAAKLAKISNIVDEVEIVKYRSHVKRRLSQISKDANKKRIVVLTGHQAERAAVLANIVNGNLPAPFKKDDLFIFSCNIIPTPKIEAARAELEEKMKRYGMKIYKNMHVSGHASREDLKQLISLLDPQMCIPAHGEQRMMDDYTQLAKSMGKKVHQIVTGEELVLR